MQYNEAAQLLHTDSSMPSIQHSLRGPLQKQLLLSSSSLTWACSAAQGADLRARKLGSEPLPSHVILGDLLNPHVTQLGPGAWKTETEKLDVA